MEGRLRNEPLSVDIHSQCAHCSREMTITVDHELGFRAHEAEAEPLVFEPRLDWSTFSEPNIIADY